MKKYVNLDKLEGDECLGHLNTADARFEEIKRRIANSTLLSNIEDFIKHAVVGNGYSEKNIRSVENFFIQNYIGSVSDLRNLTQNLPHKLEYKNQAPFFLTEIHDEFDNLFSQNFFRSVYDFKPLASTNTGKGEFYLSFFCQFQSAISKGDLTDGKHGVEVKGMLGRMGGPKGIKDAEHALKMMTDLFEEHGIAIDFYRHDRINSKILTSVAEHFSDVDKARNILINDAEFVEDLLKILTNYIDCILDGDNMKYAINTIRGILLDNNATRLANFVFGLHLWHYSIHDGHDYTMFLNGKKMHGIAYKTTKKLKDAINFSDEWIRTSVNWGNYAQDKIGASVSALEI